MSERFFWRKTGERCFQVFDRHALMLSTAKGKKTDGKVTAYFTWQRAAYCVWRLRTGRQKSPYDYRLRRKRAWPITEATS